MLNNKDKEKNYRKCGSERVREARQRAQRQREASNINFKPVALVILIIGLSALFMIVGVEKITKFVSALDMPSKEETTQPVTEKLKKQIRIDDVDITGMTIAEAKTAIEKIYPWSLSLYISNDEADILEVENILDIKLDALLKKIYQDVDNAASHYSINFDDSDIDTIVQKAKDKWDIPPKNGSISGFNKETKSFIYEDEKDGYLIDENRLKEDLSSFLGRKNYEARISVVKNEVKASITAAEAKEKYKVIGTFTTKTTDNKDRNTNISLAAETLDGLIIKPGEEFSFNNTTGNRTIERGYKPAGAYVNGVLVEEPGGGVCQVSSTLYNAVIFAGLKTTERHAHSFEPNYVTPGEDAMVSYDGYAGPDMKFINTSDTAIAIRAVLTGKTLTCSIIGIPILEEGVTVEMSSKKISDLNPPIPEYVEDKSIKKGSEVVVNEAKKGSRWATTYIIKKDGVVVKEEQFHNSTYKGKPAKIKINPGNGETSAANVEESTAQTAQTNQETNTMPPSEETTHEKVSESSVKKKESVHKSEEATERKESVHKSEATTESTVEKLNTEEKTSKAQESTKTKESTQSTKTKESTQSSKEKESTQSTKNKETTAEQTVEKLNTTEATKPEETVPKLEN